jgi:predicted ester cyclase
MASKSDPLTILREAQKGGRFIKSRDVLRAAAANILNPRPNPENQSPAEGLPFASLTSICGWDYHFFTLKGGDFMKKSFLHSAGMILLGALLCLAFGCQKKAEKAEVKGGISEEQAKAIVDDVLRVYNEGNLALADDVMSPEYVEHNPDSPEPYKGLDTFKNGLTVTRKAFPDFNLKFDEVYIKGDKMAVTWTLKGTHLGPMALPGGELPPTGKKIQYSGVTLVLIANGKIVESWFYYNLLDMFQQLGFTLTPPQPPIPEKK